MNNAGVIIKQLRALAGLSVRKTAKKINRSTGWLSELENSCGTAKINEEEFTRIVDILGGTTHKNMFKTWAANAKNRECSDNFFDGVILKFIRTKKEINLKTASKLTELSISYLSKIENSGRPISITMRNRIMVAYGYSPTSFKNLSSDPIRSKAVPTKLKLKVLLNELRPQEIEMVFDFAKNIKSRC